ncbi:MAG: glycosyltransferase family 2 protein [Acidobacteria bacterium]|nr:glycosyltransferase family 2 protein [Acidobacteriota bacterium]
MSVIIVSPDGYPTIRRLLQCLQLQTIRRELELVFVVPSGTAKSLDDVPSSDFAAVKTIEIPGMDLTSHARAAGIREASSSLIVLTEDHSLPEPEWAEALIKAHSGDWAVVGPAVKNGNPGSVLSWANFLIEYNEWLHPAPKGAMHHLPGHNSSYKRGVLMLYGSDLESRLESESLLHWDLRSKGYQLYLEPSALTRHLNFSRLLPSVSLRFNAGRLFAGMRISGWSSARRGLYAAGSFLIPFVRLFRIIREMKRPGRPFLFSVAIIPWMLPMLAVDALGEMNGYLFGLGDAARRITQIDFHREQFMNRADREQLAEFQA